MFHGIICGVQDKYLQQPIPPTFINNPQTHYNKKIRQTACYTIQYIWAAEKYEFRCNRCKKQVNSIEDFANFSWNHLHAPKNNPDLHVAISTCCTNANFIKLMDNLPCCEFVCNPCHKHHTIKYNSKTSNKKICSARD